MRVPIDVTVELQFIELREVPLVFKVDALELSDFIDSLWETKSVLVPKIVDGVQAMDANGEPAKVREIDWEIIETEMAAWLKAQGRTETFRRSELRGVWSNCANVWAKKNLSWQEPAAASPILPRSTDLQLAE